MARRIGEAELERRQRLVGRWKRSGQSAAVFAERHGLGKWALYSWATALETGGRERVGCGQGQRQLHSQDLLPVRLVGDGDAALAAPPAEGVVEIRLRGGDVVRLVGEVAAERVRVVVEALRRAC